MKIKIKICGIKTVADALLCEKIGVDAIGLVFYTKSSRYIDIAIAQKIIASLPPFITVVGLFVNPKIDFVHSVLSEVRLDCLQFHGNETDNFCHQFNRKWFKAIQITKNINIIKTIKEYPNTSAILVDTFDSNQFGGTGKSFDWSILPDNCQKPLILAGGLTPDNIQNAVRQTHPWAVDVSSGVESSRGQKSSVLIERFVNNLKSC